MSLELPKLEVVSQPVGNTVAQPTVVCWLADASPETIGMLELCLLSSNYLSWHVVLFAHVPPASILSLATRLHSVNFGGLAADAVTLAGQQLKASLLAKCGDRFPSKIDVVIDVDGTIDFSTSLSRCLLAPSSVFLVPVRPGLGAKHHVTRLFASTWEERVLFTVDTIGKGTSTVFLHRSSNNSPLSEASDASSLQGRVIVVILDLTQYLPSHVVPHIVRAALQHARRNDRLLLCGIYNLPPVVEMGAHEIGRRDWGEEARLAQAAAAETLQSACRIARTAAGKKNEILIEKGELTADPSFAELLTQVKAGLVKSSSSGTAPCSEIGAVVLPRAPPVLLTKWLQTQTRWIRRDQASRLLVSDVTDDIDLVVV